MKTLAKRLRLAARRLMVAVCLLAWMLVFPRQDTRSAPVVPAFSPPALRAPATAGDILFAASLTAPPTGTGATFNVTWSAGCDTPPAGAETALDYAAGIWGGLISSPVTIEVSACWTLAMPCDGIACGDTTAYLRNFTNAPLVDTYYPVALASALARTDLAPASADIAINFKADEDWSFDTTTPPASGTDFVRVAMHEIGHGLGFTGNMYESYNVGFCGGGPYGYLYPCPTAYDRFAVDSLGSALLSYLDSNPFTLGTRLKSDANFGGPNAVDRHGNLVKLYTPSTWQPGSSLSHLDPGIFGSGENTLMLPTYQSGARHPGPVTLAMFQDMGWLLADGSPNLSASGPMAVGVGHDATFDATLDWSGYAGQSMSYVWRATEHDGITHTERGITDTATLTWMEPNLNTVVVTATGGGISVSATSVVVAFDVTASGPSQGDTNLAYTFNAGLAPASTALLVTYHWQATDLDPVTHPDQDTADTAAFTWTTPGTKTVTVTATINGASAQAVHIIEIEGLVLDQRIFLPLVNRS